MAGSLYSFDILDSVTGDIVAHIDNGGTANLSFSGKILTVEGAQAFVENINTAYADSYTSYTITMKNDISALSATSNGENITITFATTARKSVDLTTLSGWANLADGIHQITIKAKADGYRDSEASSAVSVTKGSTTVTNPEAGNVIDSNLPSGYEAITINDETILTNNTVKTAFANYNSLTISELWKALSIVTSEAVSTDQNKTVNLTLYDKLSDGASILCLLVDDLEYDLDLPTSENITMQIKSPQLVGAKKANVILVQVSNTGLVKYSNVTALTDDTATVAVQTTGMIFFITK